MGNEAGADLPCDDLPGPDVAYREATTAYADALLGGDVQYLTVLDVEAVRAAFVGHTETRRPWAEALKASPSTPVSGGDDGTRDLANELGVAIGPAGNDHWSAIEALCAEYISALAGPLGRWRYLKDQVLAAGVAWDDRGSWIKVLSEESARSTPSWQRLMDAQRRASGSSGDIESAFARWSKEAKKLVEDHWDHLVALAR